MVRMAQDWSMRYPLVDGQGNFGSIDGDSPAAMRYTEVRLKKIAEEMLSDIDKETVDFRLNFDDSLEEPTVLPSKLPNLLLNGASGIAVGMATNMPPHNLTETVNAVCAYIDNPAIEISGLMEHVKAPDFPTGGIIYGYEGVRQAFETGRGRIVVRAKTTVEVKPDGRERIIVHEIPYQINKAEMIKKTADLVNEKKIEGISNILDESDRDGMRIVYEIKRDAITNVVLNKLFKYTELQTSFSVNNIALVKGRPEMLNLKSIIQHFVEHRHEVVVRRTRYELAQAEKRAHILQGYLIALDNLDAIIKLIRKAETPDVAREGLMSGYGLTEIQAKAVLEMRFRALTGLERDKIREEYDALQLQIAYLNSILGDEGLRMSIIKKELEEIKDKYGDGRKTDIVYAGEDFRIEDMIADEEVVISISHLGYIKRTSLSEFKVQNRGGKGSKGSSTREEDFIEHIFVASTHNYLLFFTEQGKCYWLRAFEIPEGTRTSKGRAIQNLINLVPGDTVKAYINVKNLQDEEYTNNNFIIMCTTQGTIKKTSLEAYSRPRQNGINAITVREGDTLLEARLTNGTNEVLLASRQGKLVRFNEETVRPMGRNASGVRGIRLAESNDEVIGMLTIADMNTNIMVISEKGFGKRSEIDEYRVTNRGAKGVKTINITDRTGILVAIKDVTDEHDVMIMTRSGLTIRLAARDLRVIGRVSQGVKLIDLRGEDEIAAVTRVDHEEEVEETEIIEGQAPIEPSTDETNETTEATE